MKRAKRNQFNPNWTVSPGEILDETIKAQGFSRQSFSRECGISEQRLDQIINAEIPVTPEDAVQFERVLDYSANLWINLESSYRAFLAKQEARQKRQVERKAQAARP